MKEKLLMLYVGLHMGKREHGYALLEYCAGAAIIIGVLWVALNLLGHNLSGLLEALARWAAARTQEINSASQGS
jgi:hypothetical protein